MPSFCAIATCNDRYGHSDNISFHKFPLKRLPLLKQWEAFIQKQRGEDWHASRWSSLCSRHFREDDFRSLSERRTLKKNAIPSVLVENKKKVEGIRKSTRKQTQKILNIYEDTREKEFKEILAIKERLEDTVINAASTILPNLPKTNCRLCGILSTASANFLDNYELYGLLQKCFPTINIQQEDALPKEICTFCHKHLEEFGSFVDCVWTAQTELHRKFRTKTVEKPLKIKQEPLVRVKQEEAETGYEDRQDNSGFGVGNEDYDGATDGGAHEDGDDQKFEFCDFPIIDCDIMEIINLDDPFINIPDDDNTTTQNEDEEMLQKPIYEHMLNYMPTAHELLQSHLLMEEHNYAYIDAEEFKEERQIYKTEKSDNDERLVDYSAANGQEQQMQQPQSIAYSAETQSNQEQQITQFVENAIDAINSKAASSEKRALKPIVTSVSAIQQPIKSSSSGIVVLNESIVKSGCGFQLHACMVCQLKFFSVESLKQHYTQTHGTPMVSVPGENIPLERIQQNTCKMEKEFTESAIENQSQKFDTNFKEKELDIESILKETEKENLKETKTEEPDNFVNKTSEDNQNLYQSKTLMTDEGKNLSNEQHVKNDLLEPPHNIMTKSHDERPYLKEGIGDSQFNNNNVKGTDTAINIKNKKYRLRAPAKYRKTQNVSLNAMANQYQQLRKLYQKLQKKCTNLEQNVEQLQALPITVPPKKTRSKTKCNQNPSKAKVSSAVKVEFICAECSKSFSNSNSLRQHKITHTEERKHHCNLCQRSFKRRNGLLQHLKGFHLQVKPFSCPVCKHNYALKCDMQRCKHSILRNMQTSEKMKSKLVVKKCEK